MAVAVAAIDLAYAIVGRSGVGHLLNSESLRLWLGVVSAAILIAIGARTLWIGWRARFGLETADEVVVPSRAFLTAVAATALNPLTIALWTVSFSGGGTSAGHVINDGCRSRAPWRRARHPHLVRRILDGGSADQEARWRSPDQIR
jgi:putative LysE/RhtB family amino acid efflux pump